MQIHCVSFGFKYGIPNESDLVFDVRCLPNPFYVDELKGHTGLEAPVRDFVMKWPQAQGLVPKLMSLVDYLVPLYRNEGKSQLVIAVGCTGGRHRSVVFAELLSEWLGELNVSHTGGRYYASGQSEPTASLGLLFDWNYRDKGKEHHIHSFVSCFERERRGRRACRKYRYPGV